MKIYFRVLWLLLAVSSASSAPGQEPSSRFESPTITVSGLAEINVVPDQAVLTYEIAVEEDEYDAARLEHERQMKVAMKVLRANSIDARKIETGAGVTRGRSFYYYWNHYRYRKNVRIAIPVSVKIDDLSKLEKVYQELTEADVKVPQIQFSSSKLQQYRREAFADAVKAARTKAEIMTAALSQNIGKAIQMTEDTSQHRYYWQQSLAVANSSRSAASGPGPAMEQFSSGETTVSARVNVVFELN